ncbi:ABC1 family-domain-containing protein [Fimicolochytrium jonesii]|uniref:ABC1 family-domain-containing protein n=1 Tax=Fimicolochytrium jonesii TaxID=1396493 RepID=UPI0022FEDC04|nr:ABC1 family-domain-containing protein [Fimicolochytrium jonesii]KAI8825167.1 ABC1 family-domain-containing protein [Fimicolochytrium jonesii]
MFPVYVRYRWVEWKTKSLSEEAKSREFEALHAKDAPKVLETILRLRGIFIKMGQFACTRADILPETYRNTLSFLFDQVPPLPGPEVRRILEQSLGMPLDEVFDLFDEKALGSASVGQVHRATLKADGRKVVVKMQYPDVESLFRTDFQTLHAFCKLAQPEFLPVFDEIEKQFMSELDFEREAANLAIVSANMKRHYHDQVEVPEPISSLTRPNVIVMTYLDGIKLLDGIKAHVEKMASRMGVPMSVLLEELRSGSSQQAQKDSDQSAKAGPVINSKDRVRELRRIARLARFAVLTAWEDYTLPLARTLWNWTVGVIPALHWRVVPSLDFKGIMSTLVKVHGHQVLVDGVFNADAHPGNIFLLRDGRIGLIDYGQVSNLTPEQRVQYAKLYRALADNDKEAVEKTFTDMGFKSEKMLPEVVYKQAVINLDRDGPDVIPDPSMNLQQYNEYLAKVDKTITFPEGSLMIARCSMLLRGMGTLLGLPPVSIAQGWRQFTEEQV